jgi:hypothetical protein
MLRKSFCDDEGIVASAVHGQLQLLDVDLISSLVDDRDVYPSMTTRQSLKAMNGCCTHQSFIAACH